MRQNLGIGKGKGYYNLIPIDSHIHSLSAKGVKTRKRQMRNVAIGNSLSVLNNKDRGA